MPELSSIPAVKAISQGHLHAALTAERLRELLNYDRETGVFTRNEDRGGYAAGSASGCKSHGYLTIKVDRIAYQAHRLAWLYVYGRWPRDQIDHINGIRDDNRIVNLREATGAKNQQNRRRATANNTTGVLGVSWHKRDKKFRASIQISGENKHIGYFNTAAAASLAYVTAKRKLHPFGTL